MPDPAARAYLIGGPLDGATIGPGSRPPFVYCAGAGRIGGEVRARAFLAPAPARELYHTEGRTDGHETFLYAGHTHVQCPGCKGYLARAILSCVLCGAAVSS